MPKSKCVFALAPMKNDESETKNFSDDIKLNKFKTI